MILALAGTATPVLAGLVYTWQDFDGFDTNGIIEFADGVNAFDEQIDVVAFSFTPQEGATFDSAFAFEALSGVQVGRDALCIDDCSTGKKTKKKAAKKVAKKKAAKKKAAKKTGPTEITAIIPVALEFSANPSDPSFMEWTATWSMTETVIATGEQFTTEQTDIGRGEWLQLQVTVPEPSALVILFAALGLVSLIRRRR